MNNVTLETIIFNQIKSYRGDEFQNFSNRLLFKLYPDEYIPVRSGGPWGDLKNDGYCYINRTFFHSYGTTQDKVSALKAKITSDIEGCLTKQQQVRKIIYITNDSNIGLIEGHIDDLRIKHSIIIETWSPNRLVEIIKEFPLKEISSILQLQLPEEPLNILYTVDERSIKTYSEKGVKINSAISIFSTLGFFFILFFLYDPLPFWCYLASLFVLLFLSLGMSIFVSLPRKTKYGEWRKDTEFYIRRNNQYREYRRTADCPHPKCRGIIHLKEAPEQEKYRFDVVGCCSLNPTLHSFSYNKQNIGYPVDLNFEPLSK